MGVLTAVIAVSSVQMLFVIPVLMPKQCLIVTRDYYASCYGKPLLGLMIGALPFLVIRSFSDFGSWERFFGFGIPSLVFACGMIGLSGSSKSLRAEIWSRVREVRN